MRIRNSFKYFMVLIAFSTLTFTGISRSDAASFTGLGDLPGGSINSGAFGISDDGLVIVGIGESAPSGVSEPFRWTSGGGMVGLGTVGGGDSVRLQSGL